MSWLLRLSLCAVTVGLVTAVVPDSFQKHVRFSGALIFVIVLLSPIRTLEGFDISSAVETLEAQTESYLSGKEAEKLRGELLSEYYSERLSCEVCVSVSSRDGKFACTGAVVGGVSEAGREAVLELLSTELGLSAADVEFTNGG